MYRTHPSFDPPPDPGAPLWRYMDLPRFLALLEDKALFFARADMMGDKFEGARSEANVALRPQLYGEDYSKIFPRSSVTAQQMRRFTYFNCWHESDVESAAMWGLYQRDGRGLAIRSNFECLTTSLSDSRNIYVGRVRYVDYRSEFIDESNAFSSFIHKRLSFQHEREVRAVIMDLSPGLFVEGDRQALDLAVESPRGFNVQADLAQLVHSVYIAPESPDWYATLVTKLVRRYEHDWPVHHSDLDQDPVF
jgi:hypothetical protein